MRAAQVVRDDGGGQVEVTDVPRPDPGPEEVRIAVEACGITHADVFVREGHPELDLTYPVCGGSEIAGVVDAVGSDVPGVEPGDRVNVYHHITCGACEWCHRGEDTMCPNREKVGTDRPGGFAEYVLVPAANVDPIPDGMDFVTAAAYASSFTTAYRMMITVGDVGPAETALVLGASGGVGHAALQLAAMVGAETYATTSSEHKRERIGAVASSVIDYTDRDFAAAVMELTDGRGVDIVADHVGQATWQTSIDALATGGRLVVCGATSGPNPDIDIRSVYQRHRRILGAPLGNRQDFRDVGRLIARGKVTPWIDRVVPLDRIGTAYDRLAGRDVIGKVVVRP